MRKIYFITLSLALSSCASVLYPKTETFKGNVKITTFTERDTLCQSDQVIIRQTSNVFGVRIPFFFESSKGTIAGDIYRLNRYTYWGSANGEILEVTFPSKSERNEGIILLMKMETKTIVVAATCYEAR
jgi:hypothetical protein